MQKTMILEVKNIQVYYKPKPAWGDPNWELIITYGDVENENITTHETKIFKTYKEFREALDKLVMDMEEESWHQTQTSL